MTIINIGTNEAIYLQCDIEWTGSKEIPQWHGGKILRPFLSVNMSTHFTPLEPKTDPCLAELPPPPGSCIQHSEEQVHETMKLTTLLCHRSTHIMQH